MVFWVTDNYLMDWIQLPECQPHHLVAAKMFKHVFSGNLNAQIDSCPPFPGKERHLLRATLARIACATQLCYKGAYEIDEESGAVKPAEEQPNPESLIAPETWAHQHPGILGNGKTKHGALNADDYPPDSDLEALAAA